MAGPDPNADLTDPVGALSTRTLTLEVFLLAPAKPSPDPQVLRGAYDLYAAGIEEQTNTLPGEERQIE
jgi:hypothetical protein